MLSFLLLVLDVGEDEEEEVSIKCRKFYLITASQKTLMLKPVYFAISATKLCPPFHW